jgi:polyisoprenyl-teichoic acid--peptidoglycan teichoic acid transferase
VLRAAGDALIFDGNGHNVIDWAIAMRKVSPDSMTLIKLPGGSLMVNGQYRGEELQPSAETFFKAVRDDTVVKFLVGHPEFLQKL